MRTTKRRYAGFMVALACLASLTSIARAACPVDGATPFTAGPVDPVNGFSQYVQDTEGLALELCLDGTGNPTGTLPDVCFFDPAIPENAFSALIGFGPEAFWWLAEPAFDVGNNPPLPAALDEAVLVMGAEAAWVAEIPGVGEQFPFTRLRIRLNLTSGAFNGFYRVTHPYGQESFNVQSVIGRDVNESYDIGFSPDAVNQGRVGPWLRWDATPPAPPTGYIGDGASMHPVTGSPCGTNFFRIEGFSDAGLTVPLDIGGSDGVCVAGLAPGTACTVDADCDTGPGTGDGTCVLNSVQLNEFAVVGKLYTGAPLPTPVVVDQANYSRTNSGRVSVFATAPTTADVSFSGDPNIPAGNQPMAGDGSGRFFASVLLDPDSTTVPASVQVTADNSVANPGNTATNLSSPLVDVVTITRAEYVKATQTLTIEASSSDRSPTSPPTLSATGLGALTDGALSTNLIAAPASVTVASSAGGSDTVPVTVINPVTP